MPNMAPPVKKKRWPWVVLAVVVLCGLPLGGCVALIGFGVSEINERNDAIETRVADYLGSFGDESSADIESLVDGDPPCATANELAIVFDSIGAPTEWAFTRTGFVERNGASTLSSNADPETFSLPGRIDESLGSVLGTVTTTSGTYDVEVIVTKPLATWRVCSVALE